MRLTTKRAEQVGGGLCLLFAMPFLLGGAWWVSVLYFGLGVFMLYGPEDRRDY